jgi:ATP synthase F1 complex assembly factor 2
MNTATRIPARLAPALRTRVLPIRSISYTATKAADVAPIVGTGPPPEPPTPAAANAYERVERRRRQAKLLKDAKDIRTVAAGKATGGLKKRFWKDVDVKEVDGMPPACSPTSNGRN